MSSKIRLIKIASEINIGKDTIVEYLQLRGFNIENKPTTVLTEEMVEVVYGKFKREKINAEKQREKIQKQKDKKTDAVELKKNDGNSTVQSVVLNNEAIEQAFQLVDENIPNNYIEHTDETDIDRAENVNATETVASVEIHINSVEKTKKSADDDLPRVGDVITLSDIKSSNLDNKKKQTKVKATSKTSIANDDTEQKKPKKTKKEVVIKGTVDTVRSPKADSDIAIEVGVDNEQLKPNKYTKNRIIESESTLPQIIASNKVEEAIILEDKLPEVPTIIRKQEKSITDIQQKDNNELQLSDDAYITEADSSQEAILQEEISLQEDSFSKKKKKKKGADSRQPGDKLNLKGLTVLGKIELSANKKEREKERTPVEKTFKSRKDKFAAKLQDKDVREKDKSSVNTQDKEKFKTKYPDKRKPIHEKKSFENTSGRDQTGSFHSSGTRREYPQKRTLELRDKPRVKNADGEWIANPDYKPRTNKTNTPHVYHTNAKTQEKKVFTDAPPKGTKTANYEEKKKKRKSLRDSISAVDIDRTIRSTLIGMEDSGIGSKKAKLRQKKKAVREEKEARKQEIIERESKTLKLTEFVTTSDLASMINIKANEIILKCMQLGLMVTINQRLDKDTIQLIADDYGFEVEFVEDDELEDIVLEEVDDENLLQTRSPIVTIMGHVDHGKTSLLDHIRNTNVVAGEAGGITQHIGAYRVILKNGKSITFLDTPGHEAFTAMRARGAQVTDIVVVVVAADDSVMPQTIEAISHARAANVPIIVAINKIDKASANVDRIKQKLSEQGVLVEDWGGKYQCAEISAKKGTNVNILLDKILLEAEMLDLKANPDRNAQGVVIESRMSKGWGNVASVIVQKGTLFIGDTFVAGANYGKIRALLDERGNRVKDVLPSQPVAVIGFDGLPEAGDSFIVVSSESEAREIATRRRQLRREQEIRKIHRTTLDDISAQISIGGVRDLNLIIKGDVAGSVEALSDSLLKLSTEEVRVNIILKAAGSITESDVMLAAASNAIIISFNTGATPQALKQAEVESVEIRNYNIIYDCINEIHLALEGMLKPDIKEEIVATVEVRQIFKISKIGQIAGCYVMNGKVSRNDRIRIIRNGFPIFSGHLTSLKRNKDDVKEVDANYECGIQITNFNSFEIGDIIEAIKLVEVKRTLVLNN